VNQFLDLGKYGERHSLFQRERVRVTESATKAVSATTFHFARTNRKPKTLGLFLGLICILAPGIFFQGDNVIAQTAAEYTPEEEASFERGGTAYFQLCHICHGQDGTGTPIPDDPDERKMAPSLSGSKRVIGRPEYVITALLFGVTGPVDGANYEGLMVPMQSYGDAWIADVASFIRTSFENSASMITSNQVARVRKKIGDRADPFTVPEILSMMPVALTNQAAWKVTASHNSSAAANAINRSSTNAWTSGSPQAAGMWLQIELPEPATLWEINLQSPPPAKEASAAIPRGYKAQVSMNGSDWKATTSETIVRASGTVIAFEAVKAQAVRITLESPAADAPAWAISQIQISKQGRPPPAFTGKPATNPFE
jgi:mono/diheme cytochrome c family protein